MIRPFVEKEATNGTRLKELLREHGGMDQGFEVEDLGTLGGLSEFGKKVGEKGSFGVVVCGVELESALRQTRFLVCVQLWRTM